MEWLLWRLALRNKHAKRKKYLSPSRHEKRETRPVLLAVTVGKRTRPMRGEVVQRLDSDGGRSERKRVSVRIFHEKNRV